jgi:hypothetical protein
MSLDRFRRPFDVVTHPILEPEVKRSILASWASDRAALKDRPDLRRPRGLKRPGPVRNILAGLKNLYREEGQGT